MKITIIGGGNMGGAIARGLTQGTLIAPNDITVSDINSEVLAGLKQYNSEINTSTNNVEAVQGADIVLFAVKPWLLSEVMSKVSGAMSTDQIVISIVAGVPLHDLGILMSAGGVCKHSIFRLIPNTAIAIRQSMTMIAANESVQPNEKQLVIDLFNELGKTAFVEERLMAAGTALCSCGTAYALRYVRAAMEGGVEMGFYPNQAKEIVAQTVKGAVELLLANGSHPEIEIDAVTTPGGITIKGLNEMEAAGFTTAVIRGLKASV